MPLQSQVMPLQTRGMPLPSRRWAVDGAAEEGFDLFAGRAGVGEGRLHQETAEQAGQETAGEGVGAGAEERDERLVPGRARLAERRPVQGRDVQVVLDDRVPVLL